MVHMYSWPLGWWTIFHLPVQGWQLSHDWDEVEMIRRISPLTLLLRLSQSLPLPVMAQMMKKVSEVLVPGLGCRGCTVCCQQGQNVVGGMSVPVLTYVELPLVPTTLFVGDTSQS